MGVDPSSDLTRLPAPRKRWRPLSRHRIGPLRRLSETGPHPVLRGVRSGAVAGLAIVALLSLPVLLVLGAKAPTGFQASNRVRTATPEPDVPARAWAESPLPPLPAASPVAAVVAAPAGAAVAAERIPLSVDLIPVLGDDSMTLALDEPQVPVTKPPRPNRATTGPRPPKVP